jgi:hypothetical protein
MVMAFSALGVFGLGYGITRRLGGGRQVGRKESIRSILYCWRHEGGRIYPIRDTRLSM